jgi:hypothetical protein
MTTKTKTNQPALTDRLDSYAKANPAIRRAKNWRLLVAVAEEADIARDDAAAWPDWSANSNPNVARALTARLDRINERFRSLAIAALGRAGFNSLMA